MKPHILIDFSPVKKGGALQLASNFFDNLTGFDDPRFDFSLLLPENFKLTNFQNSQSIKQVFIAPKNPIKRVFFENYTLQKIIKKNNINRILTFVGSGLPHPKNVISVIGIAYPSICFPESEHFNLLTKAKKIIKKIFDWLRIKRIQKADGIFVETELMQNRLSKFAEIPLNKITIIPPTCSDYLIVDEEIQKENKILLLSSNYYHKNLWRFYEIAQILNEKGFQIKFTVTITKEEWLNSLSEKNPDESIISNYFEFLGAVSPNNISKLYQESKALMLISDLESFSSNHPESWKAKVPQIVSDRIFMREVCRDSAIYVNPHNPTEVANSIIKLLNDPILQQQLVQNGTKYLKNLPSQQERTKQIINLLLNTN